MDTVGILAVTLHETTYDTYYNGAKSTYQPDTGAYSGICSGAPKSIGVQCNPKPLQSK